MRKKPVFRVFCIAFALLFPVSVLFGCSMQSVKETERTSFLFDTIVSVKLRYAGDASSVLDDAFSLCEHYDRLFDRFTSGSDIYRINHSGGTPVEVDPDTADLISIALEYAELSGGRFDISCGNVTKLWDFNSAMPSIPDPESLKNALETTGWQKIVLDGNSVTVPAGTELDFGGIAKGYIADKLAEFLKSRGVQSAIINLGGNVYALGDKDGQPFKVGIQSPHDSGNIGYVNVYDCSVVTAGSYQRWFELNGAVYHHILDLTSGMPADTGVESVTVIATSSAEADALATICFILGVEDGMRLIDSLDDTEALFVTDDGRIHMTEGARSITTLY